MDGLRAGMTGPEIRQILEVSQKDYETAYKWLRRNVRAKTDKEGQS
jgi:translation elongation factor EF-Ts